MTIWFTSDLHLGHRNIIEYCNRPFASVEEMDAALIDNWNRLVSKADSVYVLGDFAIVKETERVEKYVASLNGQVHLVHGNHDHRQTRKAKGFAEMVPYKEIDVGEQKLVLCHYAFKVWNKSHRGSWNLHGHSHGTLPRDFTLKQIDVGVDVWNYHPISFEQVSEEMKKHVSAPVDHHKNRDL